jgi:ABC-type lipoprotein release transport system permease subunit
MGQLIQDCRDPAGQAAISSHSGVQLVGSTFARGFAAADARITGLFTTGLSLSEDTAMIAPLAFAQKFFDTDAVTWIAVFLAPGTRVAPVLGELKAIFARHGFSYDARPYYDEQVSPFYVGAMGFVYVMTLFFLLLVCGVVMLSVLNALQVSFLERRSEAGTLRALGFRRKALAAIFVRETALLTALSLAAGGAIAECVAALFNSLNIRFYIVGASDSLQLILNPGIVFPLLVGILFFCLSCGAAALACRRWAREPVVSLLENT